jgi:hypothetical protein
MNTARITTADPAGTWEHPQGGTLYKFNLTLDDGTKGEANAKSPQPWWSVGDEVAYKITRQDPTHGNSLKLDRPEYANRPQAQGGRGSGPEVTARILSCWAITEAIRCSQVMAARGSGSPTGGAEIHAKAMELLQVRADLDAMIQRGEI